MPRTHKRELGSRAYQNYTQETLDEALSKLRNHELTQREAEQLYNIPRSTLKNKLAKRS